MMSLLIHDAFGGFCVPPMANNSLIQLVMWHFLWS